MAAPLMDIWRSISPRVLPRCSVNLVLFVVISCYVTSYNAQTLTPLCTVPGYNVYNLTQRSWRFSADEYCLTNQPSGKVESCNITMGFCTRLSLPQNCSGVGICEDFKTAQNTTEYLEVTSFVVNPFNLTAEITGDSFEANFAIGPNYTVPRTNKTCMLSANILFHCNKNAPWIIKGSAATPEISPPPSKIKFDEDTCQLQLEFQFAGACVTITPIVPYEYLSAGTVLIIIFFTTLSAYFIFGGIYNGCIKGSTGKDIVPNGDFWVELPVYVVDGIAFTFTGCKQKKTTDSTYDNI